MSEASAKKRPFFQLHLSTVILLALVAGLLLWANVHPFRPSNAPERSWLIDTNSFSCGWPFTWFRRYSDLDLEWIDSLFGNGELKSQEQWFWSGIALNGLISIVLLFLVALACEWLIRRRKRNNV